MSIPSVTLNNGVKMPLSSPPKHHHQLHAGIGQRACGIACFAYGRYYCDVCFYGALE